MTFSKLEWQKRLRGADLTHAEKDVLQMLSTYTDKRGQNAFPGVARLAEDCRLTERSVQKILRRLEAKSWIVVTKAGGNQYGHGMATTYALGLGPKGAPEDALTADNEDLKGVPGNPKGVPGVQARVSVGTPHQITTPDHPNHSAPAVAGSTQASISADDWAPMIYDYDLMEQWLETQLPGLDAMELTTAHNMWETDSHPKAIYNKLEADRFWGSP